MITVKKILCPVDFFPASDAAVVYAAGLAANYDATVHLVHVLTPFAAGMYELYFDTTDMMKSMEKIATEEMNRLVAKVNVTGVPAVAQLRMGDAYEGIKEAIDEIKPDLVVMGTHGRRGVKRWFMGSTTEKLLRHSPVPIVTISATGATAVAAPRFRRILVTTDFSDGTPDALRYAFSVAQENESQVTLLHVVQDVGIETPAKYRSPLIDGVTNQLERMIPSEAQNWCDIATRVEEGVPYRIITRVIEDERPDLLVMNIHGKGMLDRALLGSTAERVVRVANCPVMLIPPMKRKLKRKARPGGKRFVAA